MQAHTLNADSLSLFNQSVDLLLAHTTRISDSKVGFTNFLQVCKVFRRSDNHFQKRVPHRRRSHIDHLDPIGLTVKQLKILDNFVPTRHFTVASQCKSEKFFRCGDFAHCMCPPLVFCVISLNSTTKQCSGHLVQKNKIVLYNMHNDKVYISRCTVHPLQIYHRNLKNTIRERKKRTPHKNVFQSLCRLKTRNPFE